MLAHRLQTVIDMIRLPIEEIDYMGNNIRLVEDVIEHFNSYRKKGLLSMVDFTKAFDSLNRSFMFKT